MSVRVERDSFKGNASAINRELGYLDSLKGDNDIDQDSLNGAITNLNNWLGDIAFDKSIASDRRALASFRMSIAPLSMDPNPFKNGGIFRLMGYFYGEVGKNVLKYSPTLLAAKGLWAGAALTGAVGTYTSVGSDLNDGDYSQAGAKFVTSGVISRYAISAAQTTPGGRVFGTFFYASDALLGTLYDEL